MNGLEWIAGIGGMHAPESRSAKWVVSRAQRVHPDAQMRPVCKFAGGGVMCFNLLRIDSSNDQICEFCL